MSPVSGQGWRAAVSQTSRANHLPAILRALRVGLDDDAHIRRTVHLAAAKIEDLQEQVTRLAQALEAAARRGNGPWGAGAVRGAARLNGSGGETLH
jgi:hypothetical protein